MKAFASLLFAAALLLAGNGPACGDIQTGPDCDSVRAKTARLEAYREKLYGMPETLQYELAIIKTSLHVLACTILEIEEAPREFAPFLVDLRLVVRLNALLNWRLRLCLPGTEPAVGDTLCFKSSSFAMEKTVAGPGDMKVVHVGGEYLFVESTYTGPDAIDCLQHAYRPIRIYPLNAEGVLISHRESVGGDWITTVISIEEMTRLIAVHQGVELDKPRY